MSSEEPQPPRPSTPPFRGAVVGVLTALFALGIAEVVASFIDDQSSPLVAVGSAMIDATPEWLKSFAIRTFGVNDKRALIVGMIVVILILAAVLGIASIRRPRIGLTGLWVLAAVGAIAAFKRPTGSVLSVVPSIVGRVRRFVRVDLAPQSGTAIGRPKRRWSARDAGRTRPTTVPVRLAHDRRRGVGGGRTGKVHQLPALRRGRGRARRADDPGADRRGTAAPCRLRHARSLVVHHAQRRLLPRGHRARGPAGRHGRLAPDDPRHGRPRDGADARRPDGARPHRAGHHADVRVERDRRSLHRERAVGRALRSSRCSRRPASTRMPTRSCRGRSTASPWERRRPWPWTAAMRCSRSR